MNSQSYLPSIDPSSVLWDENDYSVNKHEYRAILPSLSKLMSEMENFSFLLSLELQEEMSCGFPAHLFEQESGDLWAIIYQLYDFLSKIGGKTYNYDKKMNCNLSSIPNQLKQHFNEKTNNEIQNLLNFYHTDKTQNKIYFSFDKFWNETDELITELKNKETHRCIIVDRGNEFDEFIESFTLRFEHKLKHNISIHGNKEAWKNRNPNEEFKSQLSCLLDNGSLSPQEILNTRYNKSFGNNSYYGYDAVNRVYVVFRISGIGTNIYHGHDEYDINEIPEEVKRNYGIFKYN